MNKTGNALPVHFWNILWDTTYFCSILQEKGNNWWWRIKWFKQSDEELNDSSILSDSKLTDNDNVVKDGISMQHQGEPMLSDDIKHGTYVGHSYSWRTFLSKSAAQVHWCSYPTYQLALFGKPLGIIHLKALRSQVLM